MSIKVEMPDGGVAEFPDEATAAKYFKKINDSPGTLSDELMRSVSGKVSVADHGNLAENAKGFVAGMGEAMPATKIAKAVSRLILGNSEIDNMQKEAPDAATVGKIVGEIVPYVAGGAAIKGAGAGVKGLSYLAKGGTLPGMLRGALSNVAVQQSQSPSYDPARIATDAAGGAGGELIGSITSKVGKGVLGAGSRIINAALQLTKKDMKAGKNIGEEIIRRFWKPRTLEGWVDTAKNGVSENEQKLQTILASHPDEAISPSRSVDNVKELLSKPRYSAAGEESARDTISGVLDDFLNKFRGGVQGGAVRDMALPESNVVKRGLYEAAGERSYLPDVNVTAKKETQQALARGIRQSQEAIDPEIAPINKELAFFGKLKRLADDADATQGKKGLGLSLVDLAIGGGPFAGAAATGADMSPELIIPLLAKKLMWDTKGGQIGTGMALGKVGQAIQALAPGWRGLGPVISETSQE